MLASIALDLLNAYPYTVEYRRGSDKANAEFHSRFPQPATEPPQSGPFNLPDPADVQAYPIRPFGISASGLPTLPPFK